MTPPETPSAELRKLPKADRLLEAADRAGLVARIGHPAVMEAVRGYLDRLRQEVREGAPCPAAEEIERVFLAGLEGGAPGTLRPVVNATGVVVHTNLGRAPLSDEAVEAMAEAARYGTLELDLATGQRGDRHVHAEAALCRLTGAEAAAVVNNNAAAVLLALAALCEARPSGAPGGTARPSGAPGGTARPSGAPIGTARPSGEAPADGLPEVIVSRTQLVEIGGGFRVPDVLRRSGAALVEVGTTNRTYLRDFEEAAGPRTRILLSVHRSNFKLSGFVHEPTLEDLVGLGRQRDLWVVDDIGSGALLPTEPFGLGVEPTVQERVRAGADLVCFSGDKLLGGPQAGLLVGRREAVRRVKRHPLMRALRVDKVTFAGLSATLAHHERGEAATRIPVWRAIAARPPDLAARARRWLLDLGEAGAGCEVLASTSAVGGGSLPEVTLPTFVLALPPGQPDTRLARLRRARLPVIGRIEDDRVVLDPRTVLPGEDGAVVEAVKAALAPLSG
jgi:L-seryl-tRNA(Ser) seleniumtransferase